MENYRINIRRIANAISEISGVYYAVSKTVGIKENLLWLLYSLDDGKFHSQKQICEEWKMPRATVNTLIKECETSAYVTLQTIPGCKRELQISLTDIGKEFTQTMLKNVYKAEDEALHKTMFQCSPTFISDFELFTNNLKEAFEKMTEEK